jgi:mRNA-degrading endonuclease RelE of RelBE toxin-antitoxin system
MLELAYHPSIPDDLEKIPKNDLRRIKLAIEKKLLLYPELFGVGLRGILEDFWKLRVGDYRIIYQPQKKTVYLLAVGDRKSVYRTAERRLR